MSELLLVVIGVLAVVVVLLVARSRRSTGDPVSSVDAFNRALTAMEPGAGERGDGGPEAAAGGDGERAGAGDAAHTADDARAEDARPPEHDRSSG